LLFIWVNLLSREKQLPRGQGWRVASVGEARASIWLALKMNAGECTTGKLACHGFYCRKVAGFFDRRLHGGLACVSLRGDPLDARGVNIDSLQRSHPHSVGVEQVALHALEQLGLIE
jgi:hypothetical protein